MGSNPTFCTFYFYHIQYITFYCINSLLWSFPSKILLSIVGWKRSLLRPHQLNCPLEVVAFEHFLRLRFSQQNMDLLFIIVDGVFTDLFFVILVILFNTLCKKGGTSGLKGVFIFLVNIFSHSISASQGCSLISSMPFEPNLWSGFLRSNLLIKSIECGDHLYGSWSNLIAACLDNICSFIYFLLAPRYGLFPSINSYAITPNAK